MANSKTDRVDGELLREWRESRNMDVSELAILANLSVAQIQQLESGGEHLFYSRSIKEASARKIARLLGGDPAAVIRQGADEVSGSESVVEEERMPQSSKKASSDRGEAVFSNRSRWMVLGGTVLLAVMAAAVAWFVAQGERHPWR